MLRTFPAFKPKKLRASEGFIEFWCSYKKIFITIFKNKQTKLYGVIWSEKYF